MPGAKSRFTAKEDRQAKHIMESEEKRGIPEKEAKSIAYGHLQNERKRGAKVGKHRMAHKGV
jgi:hypothetical protein